MFVRIVFLNQQHYLSPIVLVSCVLWLEKHVNTATICNRHKNLSKQYIESPIVMHKMIAN